jgi:hypothetical protein
MSAVAVLTHVTDDHLHNCSTWHLDDVHTLTIAIRGFVGRALRETISSDGAEQFCGYVGTLA